MNYTYMLSIMFMNGAVAHFYFYSKEHAFEIKKKLDKHISDNNKGTRFSFEYYEESASLETDSIVVYGTQSLEKAYQLKYRQLVEKWTMEEQANQFVLNNKRIEQDKKIDELTNIKSKNQEVELNKTLQTIKIISSLETMKHSLCETSLAEGEKIQYLNELDNCISILECTAGLDSVFKADSGLNTELNKSVD